MFRPGNFYFNQNVNFNLPTDTGLSMKGAGRNRTTLILSNGVNNDLFTITSAGNIFEVEGLKFHGGTQSGTSRAFVLNTVPEVQFYHCEFLSWLTRGVDIIGQQAWCIFDDVWWNGGSSGIQLNASTITDVRFIGNKFAFGSLRIQNVAAEPVGITVAGSIFDQGSHILINGLPYEMSITGNVFMNTGGNFPIYYNASPGSLTDLKNTIVGNTFHTTTATNGAINIADKFDGMLVEGNTFTGYTNPLTIVNTTPKANFHLRNNRGLGSTYVGWGITTPAFPSTGVDVQNTNPYPVIIYITGVGSGITAVGITDQLGTLTSFTKTVAIGDGYWVDAYGKIRFTFTGSPTFKWYGAGNAS